MNYMEELYWRSEFNFSIKSHLKVIQGSVCLIFLFSVLFVVYWNAKTYLWLHIWILHDLFQKNGLAFI